MNTIPAIIIQFRKYESVSPHLKVNPVSPWAVILNEVIILHRQSIFFIYKVGFAHYNTGHTVFAEFY